MKILIAVLLLSSAAFPQTPETQTGDLYLINNLRMGYRNMPWKIDGKDTKVKRGHYAVLKVGTGLHTVAFSGGKPVNLEVLPGEVKYISAEERAMGWGGFHINVMPQESGKFEVSNLTRQLP